MTDIRKREGKNGVSYQVRYPDTSAKTGYSYKTFPTLKQARHFTQNASIWKQKGNSRVSEVAEAVALWLEICEQEGTDGEEPVTIYTLKTYKRRAKAMCLYSWPKTIQRLTTPDVVDFRSWLLRNYSHYQAQRILGSFHTVLKEMALRGIIDSNVASGVSIKSESRYNEPVVIPTVEEVKELLSVADHFVESRNKRIAKVWQRYRPILYLAADSGMRPQEYLVLGQSNILDTGVKVTRALERGGYRITVPKTRAGRRTIDLSDNTLQMLNEYIDQHAIENKHDLIFTTSTGHWLQVEHWRNRGFAAACIEAGFIDKKISKEKGRPVPKYTPYSLRHFYASMLINQKEDLKTIQELMGHEKIETTLNIYGHLIKEASNVNRPRVSLLSRMGAC